MCNENMKLRLYLQVFLVLMTHKGFAQLDWKFNGKVQANNEPLIGVQFIEVKSGKVVALSDTLGQFSFATKTPKVVARYLGYKEFTLPSQGEYIIITLEEDENLMNTIVISESKRATKLSNTTVSLDLIRPELVENTSPTNIEESIGRISGVQVVDNQPTIRSGSGWSYGAGSRVQVLVNDIPMLSGDAGQPLWTFLPTEGIENIEVIKGASSVLYGSSALNGVIKYKN